VVISVINLKEKIVFLLKILEVVADPQTLTPDQYPLNMGPTFNLNKKNKKKKLKVKKLIN